MLVDAVAVLSIRCNQCIIWQAAIYTYGELTNSFFWLVEFSVGVLVLQITDFQECALLSFPFCKLQISILQIISIFPFSKLQISNLQIISTFPLGRQIYRFFITVSHFSVIYGSVKRTVRQPVIYF